MSVPFGRLPRFAFLSLFGVAACDATAGAEVLLDEPRVRTQRESTPDDHREGQYDNWSIHFDL